MGQIDHQIVLALLGLAAELFVAQGLEFDGVELVLHFFKVRRQLDEPLILAEDFIDVVDDDQVDVAGGRSSQSDEDGDGEMR